MPGLHTREVVARLRDDGEGARCAGRDVLDLADDAQAVVGEQVELGDIVAVVRDVERERAAGRPSLAETSQASAVDGDGERVGGGDVALGDAAGEGEGADADGRRRRRGCGAGSCCSLRWSGRRCGGQRARADGAARTRRGATRARRPRARTARRRSRRRATQATTCSHDICGMKPTVACSTAASGEPGGIGAVTSNAQPNGNAAQPDGDGAGDRVDRRGAP